MILCTFLSFLTLVRQSSTTVNITCVFKMPKLHKKVIKNMQNNRGPFKLSSFLEFPMHLVQSEGVETASRSTTVYNFYCAVLLHCITGDLVV
jgi:hypothetical protein